jgi:hypothetical protein
VSRALYRDGLVWVVVQMSSEHDPTPSRPDRVLCHDCQHARRIESDRGSIFFMCELSFEDSRFPRYPRLPVLVCSGYRARSA